MRSLFPVGLFRNLSGHLFTWLVWGSFQWRHGLLFTDCIVWNDKDNVIGFKRSHWIYLGWWSTGSPKLQLFQWSQYSHVTNCRLICFSLLSMKYGIKSYILSPGLSVFWKEDTFFLAVCLSKRYTKVSEAVSATSLERLLRKVNSPFGTTP